MFISKGFLQFLPISQKSTHEPIEATPMLAPTPKPNIITKPPKQLNFTYNKTPTLHLFYPNLFTTDINIYLNRNIKLIITKKINKIKYAFEKSKVYSISANQLKYTYDPKHNINAAEVKCKNLQMILKLQGLKFYDSIFVIKKTFLTNLKCFWYEMNIVQSLCYKDNNMNKLLPVKNKSRVCLEVRNTFGYKDIISPFLYVSSSLGSMNYNSGFLKNYVLCNVVVPYVKNFNMFCGAGIVVEYRGRKIRLVFNLPIMCLNDYDRFAITVE